MVKVKLDKEIESVLGASEYVFPTKTIILHTPTKDISLDQLVTYTTHRNFITNVTDEIFIEANVPLGTFIHSIYPFKDSLTISVSRRLNDKKLYKKYSLVLISESSKSYDSEMLSHDEDSLNSQSMMTVSMQLVDPLTSPLKRKMFTNIYHDLKLDRFMSGIFAYNLKDVLVFGKRINLTTNIHKLDNDKKYKTILINSYSSVLKLPYDLQIGDYGLYGNGVGVYYTNNESTRDSINYSLYVYPINDYDRYKNETRLPKLMIINSSTSSIQKNSLNAYLDGDTFKVLTTDVKFKDNSDEERFKVGTGLTITKSDVTTGEGVTNVTNDSINVSRNDYNLLIDEGLDNTKLPYVNQDANVYRHISMITANLGANIVCTLANTNTDFIYPGMPVSYLYSDKGKTIVANGSLQAVETIENYINNTTTVVLIAKIKKNEV